MTCDSRFHKKRMAINKNGRSICSECGEVLE